MFRHWTGTTKPFAHSGVSFSSRLTTWRQFRCLKFLSGCYLVLYNWTTWSHPWTFYLNWSGLNALNTAILEMHSPDSSMPVGMQATPLPSSLVEHASFGQGPGSLCRASGPCATSAGIIPTVALGSPDVTQSDSSITRAAIRNPFRLLFRPRSRRSQSPRMSCHRDVSHMDDLLMRICWFHAVFPFPSV